MSSAEAGDGGHHEIVIVRHGHGDHDDGHHGGAWKIAFADFMTAMMCFFLVMWLINASNDQTKAAVASYFNPVKLIDRNASRKGLEDVGDGPQTSGSKQDKTEAKKAGEAEAKPATGAEAEHTSADSSLKDQRLFADPYAVLAEIAAGDAGQPNASNKGDGGAQQAGPGTGASGGDAYRDPFAPDFWSQQVETPGETDASAIASQPAMAAPTPEEVAAMATPGEEAAMAPPGPAKLEAASPPLPAPKPATPLAEPKAEAGSKEPEVKAPEAEPAKQVKAEPGSETAAPEAAKPQTHEPTEKTIRAADQIRQELAAALLPGDKLKDGISVVATDKGVTVSVTDQLDFGMYEIGSAVPRRELVLAMEKISKAISAQPGDVTISGHTDARPFKGGGYDNWRLSSARAQSAYYMLVRAGLGEKRVTQVAGFADRKLKDPADPMSATNRRIEILLEIPQ